MEKIKEFQIKDIRISKEFEASTPRGEKIKRKLGYYDRNGHLPEDIILNDNNVLIDGYITYLVAQIKGIECMDINRGCIEIIEATHSEGGTPYFWKVPGRLAGTIQAGDWVIVRTARGARRVKVQRVIRQQESAQIPRLKQVVKRCGVRQEGRGLFHGKG